ncbi:PQQ-binding-like beta-propeller repeat protein [Halorubrum distributum]|uniref:Pyrrolo-quinoline quinone n=1 Tax=Halorubrum distributum JCM 13916 TaxID=1230455 RepID=M0PRL0_9EURY|nr:PQQ-binding-like beta-propeller repeat protein [Halorubrum arcis]EMA72214.1 hypothetical protein C462_03154 [Halorubrum arcis JCM 13916]
MRNEKNRSPVPTPSRRRFLATAAVGLAAATAGCGYVPGGGDLAWEESLPTGGLAFSSDRWFRATTDRLVTVENQSGRTYDFEAEDWRDLSNAAVSVLTPDGIARGVGETERQAVGAPTVGGDTVFLPVEDGRLTAVDLAADAPSVGGSGATEPADGSEEESTDGPVCWRVDTGALLAAESGSDETSESEDDGTADGTDATGPTLRGVRASDALAVAVGARGIAAFDAETGDPAFAVPDLWTGVGIADATPRVAVDGETVWTLVPGDAPTVGDGDAAVVGYDRDGERRAERAVAADREWLVAVGGTVVAGAPGASVAGFDRDLDRRFVIETSAPTTRPTAIPPGEERIYWSRGRTLTALDVAAGEVAFERAGLPPDHLAVDAAGAYLAENEGGFDDESEARMVAVGAGGSVRWEAPFPAGVEPESLYAVGGRVIALDSGRAYGFRATAGERWSPLG